MVHTLGGRLRIRSGRSSATVNHLPPTEVSFIFFCFLIFFTDFEDLGVLELWLPSEGPPHNQTNRGKIVNCIIITAFVERWYPETNTFHMSFREMTITLDDVSVLLVIPVIGRTVSRSLQDDDDNNAMTLLFRTLLVTAAKARDELRLARGCRVRLEWLWLRFEGVTNDSGLEVIKCSVRAYLFYVLGCTPFTDKTGTRMPVDYLHYLKDLESIHTYAWRAVALAYLYR